MPLENYIATINLLHTAKFHGNQENANPCFVGKMHWEGKHYLIIKLNKLDKIICERNIRCMEKKDTGVDK